MGGRFSTLLVLALAIMIILPSFFGTVQAQETEEKAQNETGDWTYYLQLPFALIMVFGLMVIMLAYAGRVDD